MATIAAIASSIAAWKSYRTGENALQFQKQFAKNQRNIGRIQAIIINLRRLRSILTNPLGTSDDEFNSLESLHLEIKSELEDLVEAGVIQPTKTALFQASSFGEIIDQQTHAGGEIDKEIRRLEQKIDEVFA